MSGSRVRSSPSGPMLTGSRSWRWRLLVLVVCQGMAMAGDLGAASGDAGQALKNAFREGRVATIVAFGDSVMSGFRSPVAWPQLLGQRLRERYPGVRVVNAGKPGDTSRDGLKRLRADVISRRPDLVLISFGLNDMDHGIPTAVFRRNIEAMVVQLRETGTAVVLLTTTRMVLGAAVQFHLRPEEYNAQIRKVATATGAALVDVYSATDGLNRRKLYRDLVHPNQEGHALLADVVLRHLVP